jgi:hypothetical protein
MIRDHAAAVNAASTPPPVPVFHRWRCPLCGGSWRHPWHLAAHLARPADQLGHALDELDAWTRAAAVEPVDMTPGLNRYPTVERVPMDAPPLMAVQR